MKGCLANQADLDPEWNLYIGKSFFVFLTQPELPHSKLLLFVFFQYFCAGDGLDQRNYATVSF